MSMVTFVPAVDFLGFPEGSGRRGINFKAGQESIPVSPEFAQLMRDKGLVSNLVPKRARAPIDPPKPAASEKIAAAMKSRGSGRLSRRRSSKT